MTHETGSVVESTRAGLSGRATTITTKKVSQGLRDSFRLQGMQAGLKNAYDCIKVVSETDHTEDLASALLAFSRAS